MEPVQLSRQTTCMCRESWVWSRPLLLLSLLNPRLIVKSSGSTAEITSHWTHWLWSTVSPSIPVSAEIWRFSSASSWPLRGLLWVVGIITDVCETRFFLSLVFSDIIENIIFSTRSALQILSLNWSHTCYHQLPLADHRASRGEPSLCLQETTAPN